MHKSQAFAAFRTALVAELQADMTTELIPTFNAEIEDIRRTTEEMKSLRGEALADHHKRARILDLKARQQDFIDSLNAEMREQLENRVKSYGGTIEVKKDGEKEILEATFPDKSTARVPKSLWINYNLFERV